MIAVFVFVTALLTVINGLNFTMVGEDADRITEMIAMEKGKFGEGTKKFPGQGEQRGFGRMDSMGPDSPELAFTARYFTYRFDEKDDIEEVVFHISAFSKEEAQSLAKQLVGEKSGKTGWVETKYRYRVFKSGDYTYVTVVDQGRELLPSYRILIISVIGEIGGLIICLIFLLFISEKLFRPLEEADRKQKKFLAEAKSEFQVPLTVINANAEILEKENGSSEYTQAIHRQVKKMTALTKQLDTLSIMEDQGVQNESFDLSMIVAAATDSAMTKFLEKGLDVKREIEPDILVTGDEEALHRVVAELVENSIRYAKSFCSFGLKKEEGHTVLTVNNDTDLAESNIEQVFDRFTKLSNAKPEVGNGLGLSYVKDIVKAHNGRVSAWTENGEFFLRITL